MAEAEATKMIIEYADGERAEYAVFLAFGAKNVFAAGKEEGMIAYMKDKDFCIQAASSICVTLDIVAAIIGAVSNTMASMLANIPSDVAEEILTGAENIVPAKGGTSIVKLIYKHPEDN